MLNENDTMKAYMDQIMQYPLVSPEEEIELADRIKGGSEDARLRLIRSNLRLVVKIAHDFKGRGLPLLDLICEGNVGLMRAVEKFDPSKGAKLSSYAAWWIKQSMRRALANQAHTVRVPIQSAAKINKIQNARDRLREKLKREPDVSEIAEEAEMTERTVNGLGTVKRTTFSLHDPIRVGEDGDFNDIIPDSSIAGPDEQVEGNETLRRMLKLIDTLDEREKHILALRFGLTGERPRTLEEVSQIIGRTRERIRQIQQQALAKLRNRLNQDVPEDEIAA